MPNFRTGTFLLPILVPKEPKRCMNHFKLLFSMCNLFIPNLKAQVNLLNISNCLFQIPIMRTILKNPIWCREVRSMISLTQITPIWIAKWEYSVKSSLGSSYSNEKRLQTLFSGKSWLSSANIWKRPDYSLCIDPQSGQTVSAIGKPQIPEISE